MIGDAAKLNSNEADGTNFQVKVTRNLEAGSGAATILHFEGYPLTSSRKYSEAVRVQYSRLSQTPTMFALTDLSEK